MITTLFFILGNPIFANPLDVHLEQIETIYKDVQSLQANFVQETTNEFLPKPVVQEGVLSITRPSLLHWKIEKPMEQHFYADSEKITVWSPAQNQVIITPNQQTDDISALLTDLAGLREKYLIQLIPDGDTSSQVHFSLMPNDSKSELQGDLQLWFSKDTYLLQKVEVNSPQAKTTVQFSTLNLEPKFDDQEFIFTPPKGADVQDSRL
jgi:outer membrane lipoprotein-sorting protein